MRFTIAVCALIASGSASAQMRSDADVVVIGERLTPDQIERETAEFIKRVGVASGHTPAARWTTPVYPQVLGLAPEHAPIVEAKIREVAKEVGVGLARPDCRRGNLTVSFVQDAGGVVRAIARKAPGNLDQTRGAARDALMDPARPIRWWYKTGVSGDGGMAQMSAAPPWVRGGISPGAPLPQNADSTFLQEYGSSIISSKAKRGLLSASVVVDADRAEGLPLDTVASYAALVGLAEIRPHDPPPPGSILATATLKPVHPTARDLAFLRALYRLPLDRVARVHRGGLLRAMVAAEVGAKGEAGARDQR
ncbi:MAG TPA: hypothetical protein VF636_01400 [Sphingomonas sp.]|jgi:hypothetical protein